MKLKVKKDEPVPSVQEYPEAKECCLPNSPCYQTLREKERQLREYKFKYETTKSLYEELLNVLITKTEKNQPETSVQRSSLVKAYQYLENELSGLNIKNSEVQRIKFNLITKIQNALNLPPLTSFSSENMSRIKLLRPESQIETRANRLSSANISFHSERVSMGKIDNSAEYRSFKETQNLNPLKKPEGPPKLVSQIPCLKEYLINKNISPQNSQSKMSSSRMFEERRNQGDFSKLKAKKMRERQGTPLRNFLLKEQEFYQASKRT